jgi:hypothetical protein
MKIGIEATEAPWCVPYVRYSRKDVPCPDPTTAHHEFLLHVYWPVFGSFIDKVILCNSAH